MAWSQHLSQREGTADVRLSNRCFWIALSLIAAVAVFVRLVVGWDLLLTPKVADPPHGSDMRTYLDLATSILKGQLPHHFYFQPFYYTIFLPVVFTLFGRSPMALMIVQAIIGGLTVLVIGWTAARLFGRGAGVFAAACIAMARYHIFKTQFALSDVLGAFWVTAAAAVAIWALERSGWQRWALLGLIVGCGTATRGNIVVLIPGVLGVLVWRFRGERRRLIGYAMTFLALTMVTPLPFSLYNWRQVGRWTGPATEAEPTLALGNNPESPPGSFVYSPTSRTWTQAALRQAPERVSVPRAFLGWLRHEPLAWVELKFRAALLFWSPLEIHNNADITSDGAPSHLLRSRILLLRTGWLLSLGLAGIALALLNPTTRRSPPVLFLVFCVIALFATTAAILVVARYRLTLIPLLCVFAGYALSSLLKDIRALRWLDGSWSDRRRALVTLSLLLLCPVFVFRGLQFYQNRLESSIIRHVRPHGVLADAGLERIVYDHGPRPLGGWELVDLPAHLTTTLRKTFSLPQRSELDGLQPLRLRVPLLVQTPGTVSVEVHWQGTSRRATASFQALWDVQWIEVDLGRHRGDFHDRILAMDILIRPDGPETSTWIDVRRSYGRTSFSMPGSSFRTPPAGAESCVELVLGSVESRRA